MLCAGLALTVTGCFGDEDGVGGDLPAAVASSPAESSAELAALIDTRGAPPGVDPIELAARYGRTVGPAPLSKPFAGEPEIGSSREFAILRLTGAALSHDAAPAIETIRATLMVTSEHGYFYAEDDIDANRAEVADAAATFEEDVWPLVTGIFGEPLTPGVDGDPRIIVLQANLGGGVGGYVRDGDAFLRSVFPQSNEAEIVYLDQTLRPGGAVFSSVLAHELQHLIHQSNDIDEEAWINEGLSEATYVLGGTASAGVRRFSAAPETQLNDWPISGTSAHYGAAAAFLLYVAERFGGLETLGDLARGLDDGPAGVDEMLSELQPPVSFRAAFADWLVANVVDVDGGAYDYSIDLDAEVQYELGPSDRAESAAHQFGTDYYALTDVYDGGTYTVRFEGSHAVPVLPPGVVSGDGTLWSNKGDGVNTTLTYRVDLTDATDAELRFRTWYDIEPWYDFGYVAGSTDGGASWEALEGQHTTTDDPVQVGFGPGYYGRSGGGEEPAWVDERINLSALGGKDVLLRFDYVTDGAVHGAGWAIEDLELEGAQGVRLEQAAMDGWVNVEAPLPQDWIARLILRMDDGSIVVRDLQVARGYGQLEFTTAGVDEVILAIAGATEGTNNLAPYTVGLERR